jgi:hypothetical protein
MGGEMDRGEENGPGGEHRDAEGLPYEFKDEFQRRARSWIRQEIAQGGSRG